MKQWLLKNNLSSGELSPLLWTRTDIQQYANGAKCLFNAIPLVEGGAKKRPGTRFRQEVAGALRLIPFIANSENAFLLILGVGSLQVYDPRLDEVVWQTETPYDTEQKVKELQFAHTRYRMYLVQGDTPVHRLITSTDFTNWQLAPFSFSVQPNDEIGLTPTVALKPSGIEVGKKITLTAASFPTWNNTTYYIKDEIVLHRPDAETTTKTYKALRDNSNSRPEVGLDNWIEITSVEAVVFTPEHVGSIVSINSGQVKITQYTSPTVVQGEVLVELTSDIEAIAGSWTLNSIAFTAENGYPRSVTFFKQRLVFANTKTSPNQMWFSTIANDGDFLETTNDADAFSIASSSAQSDNILHLAQRKGVVALTGGSEFLIGSNGPLTPSSAQIEQHTSYGAQKDVRPCMVGSELLFVQRGGQRLRAMSFAFDQDILVSPELSAIAPHISQNHGGIKEITYQQTPSSLVWIVLNDGKVASITLNRDQEMNAWALHDFGASVISMCSLPTGTGEDMCFMLAKRGTVTLLEEVVESALSDCEFEVVDGNANALIHVLNQPMANWTDGYSYYCSDQQPSIDHYLGQPFNTQIVLLPPDFSQVPGTTMFHKIAVHEVVLWLNQSIGGEVSGKELKHKKLNQDAFKNPLFTGYVDLDMSGWCKLHELDLTITHNKPLPFHVQSVSMLVSVNEK